MSEAIVVGGVAGSGKTTVGRRLAEVLRWRFLEGDDFHPAKNVDKMCRGLALDDADREPWLGALAAELRKASDADESIVLSCSALKLSYRDRLRSSGNDLVFVILSVDQDTLRARLEGRAGHFFAPELLESQLTAMEPLQRGEKGMTLIGTASLDAIVGEIVRGLAVPFRGKTS